MNDGNLELLSVRQVAKRLHKGPNYVYEAVRSGGMPHLRLGASIRVPQNLLEDWVGRQVQGNA